LPIRQFEFEVLEQGIAQEGEKRQAGGARRSTDPQVQLLPQGNRGGIVSPQGGGNPFQPIYILCRDNDFDPLERSVD
jgi:hypothetical protein